MSLLTFRLIWIPLLFVAVSLRAHEPFLLLTKNADGTFTAETGFSDQSSPEGLKLILRDRNTTELLSEHALPATGKLTLKIPSVPYRVTFDGGPGHKVSKPGPEAEAPPGAAPTAPAQPTAVVAETPKPAVLMVAAAATQTPPTTPALAPAVAPSAAPLTNTDADLTRIALVVGIFFLFGGIAFALGYGAGRRSR